MVVVNREISGGFAFAAMVALLVSVLLMALTSIPQAWADDPTTSGNGWHYDSSTKTLIIDGTLDSWHGEGNSSISGTIPVPWGALAPEVEHVTIQSGAATHSCNSMFRNMKKLTSVTGLNNLTILDNRATAANMFYGCSELRNLSLAGFNTSKITDMSNMFSGCTKITEVDFNSLDTSNVVNMPFMFRSCLNLTSLKLTFNTSKTTNMSGMFSDCENLQSLDVTAFDTSKVTNISYMFLGCSRLASIDVTHFNTSSVTSMGKMFHGCTGLTSLDVTHFNTSNVTDMGSMFSGCTGLTSLDVTHFNTSNVADMGNMFRNCTGLTSLDVTHFNTSNVTNMASMFYGCTGLTSLDVTHFNTSNVTDMGEMFYGCTGLTSLDVTHFNTSNVTDMDRMFHGCTGLTSLDVTHFNTSNVTDMRRMFWGCNNLQSLDVTAFDTSKVTNMSGMFAGCHNLESLDVTKFNTSNVTNTEEMFHFCHSLTNLTVSNFDTANVTNMQAMFESCTSLQELDLSSFHTSNVTNMASMFYGCTGLTSLKLTNFNTSKVKHFQMMFYLCKKLPELDISMFDTSSAVYHLPSVGGRGLWCMFVGMDECRTYKLGPNFSFTNCSETPDNPTDYTAILPTPPTTNGYNGKWTSNVNNPKGKPQYTPATLRDTYNASMAGTYVWAQQPNCTVTYTLENGKFADDSKTKTQEKELGEDLTLLVEMPTRDGSESSKPYSINANGGKFSDGTTMKTGTITTTISYAFDKWHGSDNLDYRPGATYSADADLALSDIWTTTESTVVSALPDVSRDGWSFTGWYTAATGGNKVGDAGTVPRGLTAGQTVYAQWSQNTYTITYKANGNGTFPIEGPRKVQGESTSSNQPPMQGLGVLGTTGDAGKMTGNGDDGDLFTECHMQKTSGKPFTVGNTGIVPNVEDRTQKVKLDANGGTLDKDASDTVTAGHLHSYALDSWNTRADGTGTKYAEGSTYNDDADLTLFAQWKDLDIDKADKLPGATREGYVFAGWFAAASGGERLAGTGDAVPTGNDTLYAQWTVKTFNVKFIVDGKVVKEEKVEYGKAANAPAEADIAVSDGKVFKGWDKSFDKVTSDLEVNAVLADKPADISTFTVAFDGNGADKGSVANMIVECGKTFMLPTNGFSRDGYTFAGWSTNKSAAAGSSGVYAAGVTLASDNIQKNSTLTFYAVWSKNSVQIVELANTGDAAGNLLGVLGVVALIGITGTSSFTWVSRKKR